MKKSLGLSARGGKLERKTKRKSRVSQSSSLVSMIFLGMDAKAVHCVASLSSNAVLAGTKLRT